MGSTKEKSNQVNHDMAVAKYKRYIIADLRDSNPDLIGWYADWEQYYSEALMRTSLLDPQNNAARLRYLPVIHRLYVDTPDERKKELKYARDGLRANLRIDQTSPEDAYRLFCEAMQAQIEMPPEGLIAEEGLYVSCLLKIRDPVTKRFYTAIED